jgi:hypothetical protein
MYKILTHLHTQSPGVYRYHRVKNDKGEWVEYQTETLEDAEIEMLEILKNVGSCDIKVITEYPFYLDLHYKENEDFTGEEEKEEALTMLQYLGWDDLRISDHRPFEVDVIWGTKPEMEKPTYKVQLTSQANCTIEPMNFEEVAEGSSCSATITFNEPVKSFHLVINGEEQKLGNPEWIKYSSVTDNSYVLVFNGITTDYIIEIVAD